MRVWRIFLVCLLMFCLAACAVVQSESEPNSVVEITDIVDLPTPAVTVTTTPMPPMPLENLVKTIVTVAVVTPEPTPTFAVCTSLPDGMNIQIHGYGDLHGVIEIAGLESDTKPALVLMGVSEVGVDSWRSETQMLPVPNENGRFHKGFDFRTWDSIEGYHFSGQIIYQGGVACFDIELPLSEELLDETKVYEPHSQPILPLIDYPPSDVPYYIESDDLWFVHHLDGQMLTFLPTAPTYKPAVDVQECRFIWSVVHERFIDPCSGDEWNLLGQLDLENSSELWSDRNLDQYAHSVMYEKVYVSLKDVVEGQPAHALPLAVDAQFGVTVTAVTAYFLPTSTLVETLVQVDPIYEMDPSAFPLQQALIYHTFPDSLFDAQGGTAAPVGSWGGFATVDSTTGGLQQRPHVSWEGAVTDAEVVTATVTVSLTSLYREMELPLDWETHQEGDVWAVDLPLDLGHVVAKIEEVTWTGTTEDGHAQLMFTVRDTSPEGIELTCLHIAADEDPWKRTCSNFDSEKNYGVIARSDELPAVHLRANIDVIRPFTLVLNVTK